jgi:hypothetical protein
LKRQSLTQSRKFSDLTDEEKAAVISGLAFAATLFVAYILFHQFFIVEDKLHIVGLGRRAWITAATLMLPTLFLVGIPPLIVYLVIASSFVKKSAKSWVKVLLSILVGIGAYLLLTESVLILLDILLANDPLEIQPIIVIPSILICGVIMTRIFLFKRVMHAIRYSKEA